MFTLEYVRRQAGVLMFFTTVGSELSDEFQERAAREAHRVLCGGQMPSFDEQSGAQRAAGIILGEIFNAAEEIASGN